MKIETIVGFCTYYASSNDHWNIAGKTSFRFASFVFPPLLSSSSIVADPCHSGASGIRHETPISRSNWFGAPSIRSLNWPGAAWRRFRGYIAMDPGSRLGA